MDYQTIINAVVPVAVTALVGVLVAVIKVLGDAGVQLIRRKSEAVRISIGVDRWNHYLSLARTVWGIVDEEFRITPTLEKTAAAKQAEFEAQIKKLIPAITDEAVDQLRQAVAGEVNKGRDAIGAGNADGDLTTGNASAPTAAELIQSVGGKIVDSLKPALTDKKAITSDTTGAE